MPACLHACATSSTDEGAYDLVGGEELSDAEREELLQLCRQRVRETGFSES